jgi:Spy/CpxP family protein refolding chaperone
MIRIGSIALILCVSPALATAQDRAVPRTERPRIEAQQQRRAQLEQQVRRQFVTQAADALGLDTGQRNRLDGVMRGGVEEREQLAQESRELRMELMRAVRNDAVPTATYERLLARMSELRERERRLELREEAALAEFLDPRQRAHLIVLRMQLNERVRGMRGGPQGERRSNRPGGTGA